MIFLQRTLASTAVAAAATLGLAPVAHADVVVFDGSSWTSTTNGSAGTGPNGLAAGGVSSSTTSGPNATTTLTSVAGGVNGTGYASGSDFVTLATPITSNSGIWSLTTTVNMTVPANVPGGPGEFAGINVGFGSFASTLIPLNGLGNTFTGFNDGRYAPNASATESSQFILANGRPIGNSGGVESQTGPVTFKMTINTDSPQWTITITNPNGTTQQITDANPTTLTQFGISLAAEDQVTSATFSNTSLTDSPAVQAVPEPTTWAMMVVGFAGVGLLSYGRTRRKGGLNLRLA